MDQDLITEIKNFIETENLDCVVVSEHETANLVENLAKHFGFDLSHRYLWEGVCMQERIAYNDYNWEKLMFKLFGKFQERVFLVVSDDDFYPWIIFNSKKELIINLLKAQRYFEYFIFDQSMSHVLFDTHDNQLLMAAKKIYL
jgi:hypothetical protein